MVFRILGILGQGGLVITVGDVVLPPKRVRQEKDEGKMVFHPFIFFSQALGCPCAGRRGPYQGIIEFHVRNLFTVMEKLSSDFEEVKKCLSFPGSEGEGWEEGFSEADHVRTAGKQFFQPLRGKGLAKCQVAPGGQAEGVDGNSLEGEGLGGEVEAGEEIVIGRGGKDLRVFRVVTEKENSVQIVGLGLGQIPFVIIHRPDEFHGLRPLPGGLHGAEGVLELRRIGKVALFQASLEGISGVRGDKTQKKRNQGEPQKDKANDKQGFQEFFSSAQGLRRGRRWWNRRGEFHKTPYYRESQSRYMSIITAGINAGVERRAEHQKLKI